MTSVHQFDNGIKVYDRHLGEIQRQRYQQKNVHEEAEEEVFIHTIRALPDNAVYVNLGTAFGYYALLAKKIRNDLVIHCFEPLAVHIRFFKENIQLNGFHLQDFIIHELAISGSAGRSAMVENAYGSYLTDDCPALSLKRRVTNWMKTAVGKTADGPIQVRTMALPQIHAVTGCNTIHLIHMDIQGYEEPALRAYFSSPPPSQCSIESFLIGTHGKLVHDNCCQILSAANFSILHNEQAPPNQPDGILLASSEGK